MKAKNQLNIDVFKIKNSPVCYANALGQDFRELGIGERSGDITTAIKNYIEKNFEELAQKSYENKSDTLFSLEDYYYSENQTQGGALYELYRYSPSLYADIVNEIKIDHGFKSKLLGIDSSEKWQAERAFLEFVDVERAVIDTTDYEKRYAVAKTELASKFDENILRRKKHESGVLCLSCNSQNIMVLDVDRNNERILVACKDCAEQWYGKILHI